MDLLYTDNRIVVCLKPAGVLSTDEPGGMPELLRRALGEDGTGCVRVVHRLDRPVGGVMVYARSRMADSILSRQVQAHTFEKDYLAVLEGIQELSQIRKEHIKMIIDGEEVEDDFLFGAICNSTSVGGILTLDPEVVDLQDNKLEILLVRAPKNLAEIHECIVALNTQKYNCAMLTFRSATHIRIFADPEMPWTLDGEREEGHSEVVVTPQHLAYRLMKRQ